MLWQALFWRTKCQHSLAPVYLCDELRRPADTEARRRLRSALSTSLGVRRTRVSTVGDRAFPVTAARLSNSLPSHVTAAPPLSVFCCRLKSHLFSLSYPAFWLFSHLYGASVVIRQCECQMSKTFIGGAVCREFDSEAPVAEENVRREQFSLYMCLENGDYITWTI